MNRRTLHRAALAATALAVMGLPALAIAQAYPAKPIRLVVPYPPGGGTDFFARTVGAKLADVLGQQVIVENKPGASTIIGADSVAKSPPDGYTLLLGDTGTYAVNPTLYKQLSYDPVKDFEPVTLTGRFALLLVANPAANINSVQDLVALAKSKPGTLNYASPGPGSPHHLAMEMFKQRTGAELVHVPYKGAAPAVQDLIGGQVPVMFLDLAAGGPLIKGGKVKALAVAAPKRIAPLPDVPTIAESGIDGFEAWAWQGIVAPAKTPPDVVAKLNDAYRKAIADPAVRQKIVEAGIDPLEGTPQQLVDYIESEKTKWAKVIAEGNIKVE
jgi:tripartite-type tricarboxylate transporter receptor subunit TctC